MSTPPAHLWTGDANANAKRWQGVQEYKTHILENDQKVGVPKRTEQEVKDLEESLWARELMLESSIRRCKEKEAEAAKADAGGSTDGNAPTHAGDGTALQKREHEANPVNPMKRTMG